MWGEGEGLNRPQYVLLSFTKTVRMLHKFLKSHMVDTFFFQENKAKIRIFFCNLLKVIIVCFKKKKKNIRSR